ncbi:hypothetical protein SKAU_G00387460 [Synaphobranchus kaupii]|uniref:Uncharacterized protein n=1 Tax=Synaphobranchus kaupii TaxID=118154 RepID=A0A9Q1EAU4_SYNKA|nr:hypothetical protein SKAU_G00387460 [Synaphobranchus kaupii]
MPIIEGTSVTSPPGPLSPAEILGLILRLAQGRAPLPSPKSTGSGWKQSSVGAVPLRTAPKQVLCTPTKTAGFWSHTVFCLMLPLRDIACTLVIEQTSLMWLNEPHLRQNKGVQGTPGPSLKSGAELDCISSRAASGCSSPSLGRFACQTGPFARAGPAFVQDRITGPVSPTPLGWSWGWGSFPPAWPGPLLELGLALPLCRLSSSAPPPHTYDRSWSLAASALCMAETAPTTAARPLCVPVGLCISCRTGAASSRTGSLYPRQC